MVMQVMVPIHSMCSALLCEVLLKCVLSLVNISTVTLTPTVFYVTTARLTLAYRALQDPYQGSNDGIPEVKIRTSCSRFGL